MSKRKRLNRQDQIRRDVLRRFKRSPRRVTRISGADLRRMTKFFKPILADLIRDLVYSIDLDDRRRLIIHAPALNGPPQRITYDPKKDWWESEGSAGWGWAGMVARIWNQQDGGPLSGLDVLEDLAGACGLTAFMVLEHEPADDELPSKAEDSQS